MKEAGNDNDNYSTDVMKILLSDKDKNKCVEDFNFDEKNQLWVERKNRHIEVCL